MTLLDNTKIYLYTYPQSGLIIAYYPLTYSKRSGSLEHRILGCRPHINMLYFAHYLFYIVFPLLSFDERFDKSFILSSRTNGSQGSVFMFLCLLSHYNGNKAERERERDPGGNIPNLKN